MAVSNFTLAVDRRFKKDGEQTADFIQCVAFGKLGEHVEKYYRKGLKVAITGHIQTGSYVNKEGRKTYTTKVVADELEFAESKAASQKAGNGQNENTGQQSYGDGFEPLGDNFTIVPVVLVGKSLITDCMFADTLITLFVGIFRTEVILCSVQYVESTGVLS